MKWFYSDKVKDHFLNPRNVFKSEEEERNFKADIVGEVGNVMCGDILKIYLKVKEGKIVDCKFKTWGCASAISSMSMLSEMIKGKTLDEALKIKPKDITGNLEGLPPHKVHCSVLSFKALREAIEKYKEKNKF